MGITTTFNADYWENTTKDIVFEWLADSNCFNHDTDAVVTNYKTVTDTKLELPRVEFDIASATSFTTGAGRGTDERVFRQVLVEITVKVDRGSGTSAKLQDYQMTVLCDRFDKYSRTVSGLPALGTAKLKKANISGPFPEPNSKYIIRNYLLTFRIEVK